MSPYISTIDQVVARFNSSPDRLAILRGFLLFRQRLRGIGINGWQWVDGSFLENVEVNESRPPNDIDVVTFCFRPASVQAQPLWEAFVKQHADAFHPDQAKANFRCDARFVELNLGPYGVVSQARYWFGLFSHQRITAIWKGLVEVPFPPHDDDANARAALGI